MLQIRIQYVFWSSGSVSHRYPTDPDPSHQDLKNDVNVPSKSNKQKNNFTGYRRKKQDPDLEPDPLIRGTDQWIRIKFFVNWLQFDFLYLFEIKINFKFMATKKR